MAYTASDAYCAQASVEARVQRGAFGTTTIPTATQVLEFMAQRAAQIQGLLFAAGQLYTPSSGGNAFPSGSASDFQKALQRLAEAANAVLAAADVAAARSYRESGTITEEAKGLWAQGRDLAAQLDVLAKTGGVGEASEASVAANTQELDEMFSMDTEW